MANIVYLAAPAPLTDQLILAGHQVWEALAISEVLQLLSAEHVDVVLVGAEVVNRRGKAAPRTDQTRAGGRHSLAYPFDRKVNLD